MEYEILMNKAVEMRTVAHPCCPVCGSAGHVLYENMHDRLFNTSGTWNIRSCTGADCGLLWLDPQPIPEDIGTAYQEYYTHHAHAAGLGTIRRMYDWLVQGYVSYRYAACITGAGRIQEILGRLLYLAPGKRAVVDYMSAGLDVIRNGSLLEVGCGSGDTLVFLATLGWKTVGIDVDPVAVEVARKRGLDVRVGSIMAHRFDSESFDAIVMNHVIEHLHDPLAILAECKRVLRPGGCLVLVTPNTASLLHRVFGRSWMSLDPPRHLYLFSSQSLIRLVCKAGFEIDQCRSSIRDADGVYAGSSDISLVGIHRMGERLSLGKRIRAAAMQFVEWILFMVDAQAGEEIVMTAVKR